VLLRALTSYYERLEESGADDLPPYGFSTEKIAFCVVLERDGSLHAIQDLRVHDRDKVYPQSLRGVPYRGDRSSGIKPNFLWDNTGYVLGADSKGKPARTKRAFESFVFLHRQIAALVHNDRAYTLVVKFLDTWQPAQAKRLPNWAEICDQSLVFKVRGQTQFVHESEAVRAAWRHFIESESDAVEAQCLVTGERAPVARLHGLISGFPGARTSGAAIVSFNERAFESYGLKQGLNAPVAARTVFKYRTALARLLADRRHSLRLAGDTVLFWTDQPDPIEEFFGPAIDGVRPEDEGLVDRLRVFFARLRQGKGATEEPENTATRFFIVGISPNKARLSIRFWHHTTVAELSRRLAEHVNDLAVDGDADDLPLTVRDLIAETARDPKDAPLLLAGALLRSILTGATYPEGLYTAVVRRIRADGELARTRTAILKACLVRKFRRSQLTREVPVSLDPNNPDSAYQLGRLFATLEKIQRDALGSGLNATIKDRFFGAASATPATVFPRLIRMSQYHLSKIENPGWRMAHEKRLGEICDHLPPKSFPSHLNLDDQGLFAIGYYHQNRALFQRSSAAQGPIREE
jgi:CRISPR-associated protein Csd1